MSWIKNVLIDLATTILIVLGTVVGLEWAAWIVFIYTPVMVLLKLAAFLGPTFTSQFRRADTDVPIWFYHLTYFINVGLLTWAALTVAEGSGTWWLAALGWLLIWGLSVGWEWKMRGAQSK